MFEGARDKIVLLECNVLWIGDVSKLVYDTVTWWVGYYTGLWVYMHTRRCHGAPRVQIRGHLSPKYGHLSTLGWCLSIWYRSHTGIWMPHCGPTRGLKLAHCRRSLALGRSIGHQCWSLSPGRHVRTPHTIKHTFTNKIKQRSKNQNAKIRIKIIQLIYKWKET